MDMQETSLREKLRDQVRDAAHEVRETGACKISLTINGCGQASREGAFTALINCAKDLGGPLAQQQREFEVWQMSQP